MRFFARAQLDGKAVRKLERQLARMGAKLEESRLARRDARAEANRFRSDIRRLACFEYGSVKAGASGWSRRWENPDGLRVLMFATKDYSGSFSRMAEALNRYSPHAVRCVVAMPHPYGYQHDLVIPKVVLSDADPECNRLLEEADVIHLKDEVGFLRGRNGLPGDLLTRAGKPIVHTQYGGWARANENDEDYRAYVASFAATVCVTPDLCFEWGKWDLVPFPIDTDALQPSWTDRRSVAHSPSSPGRKGTAMFLDAVSSLDVDVDVISGESYADCLERKRHAGLFFDQAGAEDPSILGVDTVIGWYGNSTVESAAYGIPTVVHLSGVALRRAERAGMDVASIPLLNAPRSSEGMREIVASYFARSAGERQALSGSTREWAVETHSYPVVASRLACVYERVMQSVALPLPRGVG